MKNLPRKCITNLDEQQQIALVRITVSEREVEYLHRFLGLTLSYLCESLGDITHGRRPNGDRLDVWVSEHKYADEGMENHLAGVLVRRTPDFRTYLQKSIVSKYLMDVT